MAIKAAASGPSFKPSAPVTSFPSLNDLHPNKLGFTPETLEQRLPFGPTTDRYISFENLCHHILSILQDQWACYNNTIILCSANSMLILDCWDCGLPKGEKYHTTTPENKKLSWIDQVFQALVKNGYILSFKTDEGHIWIEKNKMVDRLTSGVSFRNPELASLYEDSDTQKPDAPTPTSGKGKDIPLSPPSYLKTLLPVN